MQDEARVLIMHGALLLLVLLPHLQAEEEGGIGAEVTLGLDRGD